MSVIAAKICGIRDPEALEAALAAGAAYIGFVFFPPSPRAVTPIEAAALSEQVGRRAIRVGLIVNATDVDIAAILAETPLDVLQLHGSETPERVAVIKARTGKRVMKAIKVSDASDFDAAEAYLDVADMLLFDAKPPAEMANALPGGNAVSFDWTLLAGRSWSLPWMLSGGLDPENVAEAIRVSGASAVDVSSGVENAPGVKDAGRIAAFLAAVKHVR